MSLTEDELVAVIVKFVAVKIALAEPVIAPVDVFSVSPDGKDGATDQVTICPPEFAGAETVPKEFWTRVAE